MEKPCFCPVNVHLLGRLWLAECRRGQLSREVLSWFLPQTPPYPSTAAPEAASLGGGVCLALHLDIDLLLETQSRPPAMEQPACLLLALSFSGRLQLCSVNHMAALASARGLSGLPSFWLRQEGLLQNWKQCSLAGHDVTLRAAPWEIPRFRMDRRCAWASPILGCFGSISVPF